MKKLSIPFLASLIMLAGCGEINDRLDALEERVDDIEMTQIATINQQITSINNSILLLNNTDKELGAYIASLETESAQLETKLAETNAKIDIVKNELTEVISTEKANILAELEAFKAIVNGEIDTIEAVLETLKAKDTELDGKIATLQKYVDTLKPSEDWATSTFATLEQYNEVVATIATIEGAIEGINESIAALEIRINEKVAKDIETAYATLSEELQNTIKDITEAYASAIATAKNELTEAYAAALEGAISALETSMKEWVNEQLTAYSTIVSTEAKITSLQSEIEGKLAANKTYLEALVNTLSASVAVDITAIKKQIADIEEAIAKNAEEIKALRGELAEQKAELTEAYTTAIAEAIATAKGDMSKELAAEIAAINERINKSDIAAIEALVANCKARMEAAEADIVQLKRDVLQLQADVEELQQIAEKLLSQIQSINYIPTYDDGKATINYLGKRGTLDFQISPKNIINDLATVWKSALSFKAVHTQTRAVDFINLPITSFKADATNGTISIEVDGTNLSDAFYNGDNCASGALCFDDGKNEKSSSFIPMTSTFVAFEDELVESICIENWDTNKDGKLSFLEAKAVSSLGKVFSSGGYTGRARDIKTFNELKYFTGLTDISYAFDGCKYLTSVSLPESVISIGESAFEDCDSLSLVIPNHIMEISNRAFYNSGISGVVSLPNVTSIGSHAFAYSMITSVVIGDYIESIEEGTFYNCNNLRTVELGKAITSIASNAFNVERLSSSGVENVYIKALTPPTNYYRAFDTYADDFYYGPSAYRPSEDLIIYVPRTSLNKYLSKWDYYREYIVGFDFE